jgi:AcrR family transcriptional regulator
MTRARASMPAAGRRVRTRLPRAEREAQMLSTARALFAARGYADVTMDEVARAVGVTKPLLYNYYGNKEQLFLACMEPAAEALVDAVVSAVQGADDAPGALRAGIHAFFAFLDSDGEAWRLLHDETLPAGGEIAARVGEYRARMEALVTASIRSESRAVEPLSVAIFGAAEALGRWWLRTGELSAERTAELLIRTIEPGLRMR